jgi:LmbE family N-acetylglucosaminyl deacetylase
MEIAPLHRPRSYAWTLRAADAYQRLMRVALSLLLLALTAAPLAAQMTRATRSADFSRMLVITAHPDDESLVAPLLGSYCAAASTCKLLVITRGENGDCALDDASCTSLGDRRAAELTAAAAILHTQLEQWSLPDVMADVTTNWGGHDAVVERLKVAINNFNPTVVITFDPAHGTTCHPAHRAIGQLAADAAGTRPLFFIETRARLSDDGRYLLTRAVTGASHLFFFDVSASWHFIGDDMRAHASQFTYDAVDSVLATADKTIVLMPAGGVAAYDVPCE